ncbi:MAG: M56 family metallopeptidase [Planctomycetota bacterium]
MFSSELIIGELLPNVASVALQFSRCVTMTMVHVLWQGLLLVVCWQMLQSGMGKGNRSVSFHQQYRLAMGCLLILGALPLMNFCLIFNSESTWVVDGEVATAQPGLAANWQVVEFERNQNSHSIVPLLPVGDEDSSVGTWEAEQPTRPTTALTHQASAQPFEGVAAGTMLPGFRSIVGVGFAAAYFIGAICMLLRRSGQLRRFLLAKPELNHWIKVAEVSPSINRAAFAAAKALRFHQTLRIGAFMGQGSAMVVGIMRPVVLVNVSLVSGLTPSQLEQVIAHELAHILRADPLAQLIQRLIETILYFHPAVWWISGRVSRLRELACDERVSQSYDRVNYAETLVTCAEMESSFGEDYERAFQLSATGNGASELTQRVHFLLDNRSNSSRHNSWLLKPFIRIMSVAAVLAMVGCGAFVVCQSLSLFEPLHESSSANLLPVQEDETPKVVRLDNSDWAWQSTRTDKIDSSMFLFGGTDLVLADSIPDDISVTAMIDVADFRFAQWQYGNSRSRRVAVLIQTTVGRIERVFLDKNRDRIISPDEELNERVNDVRTMLATLDVEVVDRQQRILSRRNIGLTLKSKGRILKVTTLGFVGGQITIDGRQVDVRRVDRDGDGMMIGPNDEILLDLNEDGVFAVASERQLVRGAMTIEGELYSVFSDALGHSLKLSSGMEMGRLAIQFQPKVESDDLGKPEILKLEGSLRHESGMLIAIRKANQPKQIPAGKYTFSNLLLRIRDVDGSIWHMTLAQGSEGRTIDVVPNQLHEHSLLESLEFQLQPIHLKDRYSGHLTHVQPQLVTASGLVVTNLVRQSTNDPAELDQPTDLLRRVSASFSIDGTEDRDRQPIKGSSCYG